MASPEQCPSRKASRGEAAFGDDAWDLDECVAVHDLDLGLGCESFQGIRVKALVELDRCDVIGVG